MNVSLVIQKVSFYKFEDMLKSVFIRMEGTLCQKTLVLDIKNIKKYN